MTGSVSDRPKPLSVGVNVGGHTAESRVWTGSLAAITERFRSTRPTRVGI